MCNCNTSRVCTCGVYVRMSLAACGPTQAARQAPDQHGSFAHATNRPSDPARGRAHGPPYRWIRSALHRPVVPNGNALMMRMRPFWVNGGTCLIEMLW